MDESLTPKQIAEIKARERAARIRRIRQRVATVSVSMLALLSGAIIVRGSHQPTSTASQPSASSQTVSQPATAPSPTPIVTSQS